MAVGKTPYLLKKQKEDISLDLERSQPWLLLGEKWL